MEISSDYEDLFKTLNKYNIKYLVVGAYAVIYYSRPRYTKDIDVWIDPELNDVNDIYNALKTFGAPLKGIKPEDFLDKKMIYQIGVAPVRIDIITGLSSLEFKLAWKNRSKSVYGKTPINIIGLNELKIAKEMAGRPHDKIDLQTLQAFAKMKNS